MVPWLQGIPNNDQMQPPDPVDPQTLWTAVGVISGWVAMGITLVTRYIKKVDDKLDDVHDRITRIESRSHWRRREDED